MNFDIFYLPQYMQNIILMCKKYENINELVHILFFVLSL